VCACLTRSRICAVTPEDVAAATASCPAVKLVVIKPVTLSDVLGDIQRIAQALGVPKRGERLVALLNDRLGRVTLNTREVAMQALPSAGIPADGAGPRVAHIEWLAPLMGSGYWIAECVAAASCTMVHGTVGGHSPTLQSLTQLADAEVIIIAPCGFSIERTQRELCSLAFTSRPEWAALPAVKAGRVFVADGNLYFNRSSCCVVDTAEMVAEMAWPALAGLWGHHGRAWVRLSELEAFCEREGAAAPTKRVTIAEASVPAPKRAKFHDGSGGEKPSALVDSAAAHVRHQIDFLRSGDFASAFELNSEANRARIGDASNFEAVVRGNSSFGALADAQNAYACLEGAVSTAGRCTVEVCVTTAQDGVLTFAFDVIKMTAPAEQDKLVAKLVYATEGVRILC
jgi:hypothetical protein